MKIEVKSLQKSGVRQKKILPVQDILFLLVLCDLKLTKWFKSNSQSKGGSYFKIHPIWRKMSTHTRFLESDPIKC